MSVRRKRGGVGFDFRLKTDAEEKDEIDMESARKGGQWRVVRGEGTGRGEVICFGDAHGDFLVEEQLESNRGGGGERASKEWQNRTILRSKEKLVRGKKRTGVENLS